MAHSHPELSIKQLLLAQGLRTTKTRMAVLRFLQESTTPLTASDLILHLHTLGINVNKTTVYREIDQLLAHGIVQELDFGDLKKRYELASREHHHHLICKKCGHIDDIHLENDLQEEEARIAQECGFLVLQHSLEFFGLCKTCQ